MLKATRKHLTIDSIQTTKSAYPLSFEKKHKNPQRFLPFYLNWTPWNNINTHFYLIVIIWIYSISLSTLAKKPLKVKYALKATTVLFAKKNLKTTQDSTNTSAECTTPTKTWSALPVADSSEVGMPSNSTGNKSTKSQPECLVQFVKSTFTTSTFWLTT